MNTYTISENKFRRLGEYLRYVVRNDRFTEKNISKIEKLYRETHKKIEHLKKTTLQVVCNKTKELGGRFYYKKKENDLEIPIIFNCRTDLKLGDCYNEKPVIKCRDIILTTAQEDLPTLLIYDNFNDDDRKLLLDIISGNNKGIPYRQDLYDLYLYFKCKHKRFYKKLTILKAILIEYARSFSKKLIRLKINGHEYLIGEKDKFGGTIYEFIIDPFINVKEVTINDK